jgi:hypothetical protein
MARPLSRRERQVVALRDEGLPFKAIAAKLGISLRTAATFNERAVAKMCDSSQLSGQHAKRSMDRMTATKGSELRTLRTSLGVPGVQVGREMSVTPSRVYGIEGAERVSSTAAQRYIDALRRLAAPARAAVNELDNIEVK